MYNFITLSIDSQVISATNSYKAMEMLNINPENIKKCVEDSFATPGDYQSDNRILKEDQYWSYIMEVREHPMVTINNHTYHGEMTGPDISNAICVSFKDRPQYCQQDVFNKMVGAQVDYEKIVIKDTSDQQLIFAAVVILMVNIGMIIIHKSGAKKKQKTEIQLEVNAAVSQYFALRGDEP